MGVLLDEVCCIRSSSFNENSSNSITKGKDSDKNLGIYYDKIYNSSLLKSLPENEIKYVNIKTNSRKEFKSLKTLPINTQNIIRRQSGNPLDYYDIIKKIGKGTFGTVYKVIHKTTGTIRAMKVIPKNNMRYGFTDDDIIQEINILKTLEHPHIIRIFEFYTTNDSYYLINEFCTEGDLSDKLAKLKSFPEFFVKILMIQIFNAVKYLNEKNVIHGDLKLENIMIDSYLNKGDLVTPTKNNNFITSLLEDEKEINEVLRQNDLKRSSTFLISGQKKFQFKKKKNQINKKDNNANNDDDIDSVEKLLEVRIKRGKTINSSYKFKKQKDNISNNKKIKNRINKSKSINNDIYKEVKEEEKKKDFKYLNGEEDDDDDNENTTQNNGGNQIEPNGIEIKNNKNKIINKYLDNSTNKYLPPIKENEETKFNKDEHYSNKDISKLRKTNTINLNSMKIKNFELKLIDFGCAKIFSKYKKNFEDTIGTLIYCSPEVLKNNYNKKCDIWSCGVLMYVLLSGHFPFFGKTQKEIIQKILSGKFKFDEKYFKNVSNKAKDLISKCLIYDKNKRISIEEVLRHEFFADDLNPNNIFEDEIDSKNALISLKNYSQHSKIYQTVLAYLSHNFADKEQLNKLKKIFYKIDLNLDGKLSKEELYTAFKEAGMEMEKDQLNKVIESIDFDGNGYIEYEEFIRVTLPEEQLFTETNLKTAFDMFDLDKNGTISLNEFKEILGLGKIKDKNVNKELLKEIPIKGNQEITFEQFKKILIG